MKSHQTKPTVNINTELLSLCSQCWKEVEDLHIKKEIITKVTGEGPTKVKRHEHGVDEDDLSEFLDWRSKKSWK